MQESECRSVWSYAVESKGASEAWVVGQVCEDLETVGLQNDRVIAKSDNEPSVVELAKEIARQREGKFGTALDNSAVGDSDSNGIIERAIQDVEGQCRTMRSALEARVGTKVSLRSPIAPWLIRHAGYLITRCRIRPNGRTAFQAMKGRRSNGKLAEFGEVVHFLIPKTKDNVKIKIEANIDNSEEAKESMKRGIDGIGLYRSEYLFMNKKRMPSENEQYDSLKKTLKYLKGKPLTIRTLDIGNDKKVPSIERYLNKSPNPALGLRAIRLTLAFPKIKHWDPFHDLLCQKASALNHLSQGSIPHLRSLQELS